MGQVDVRLIGVEPPLAPGEHGEWQVVEVESSISEPVFVANRPVTVGGREEDPPFDEASEPARENVGRDREVSLEFVESAGPEEGLSNDQAGFVNRAAQDHGLGGVTRPWRQRILPPMDAC